MVTVPLPITQQTLCGLKTVNGVGCNSGATIAWAAALTWANDLDFAGKTDWRLPNRNELASIVDSGTVSPTIDTDFFTNTKSFHYWSSTTYVDADSNAWNVQFNTGHVCYDGKGCNTVYARAVRGG